MATILLCGVDLLVRGKLEAVLPEHRFTTTEGVDAPDLVIADIARIDATDVADTYPDVPILGYTNHTDTAGLRRAHEAGFDQVVAKSALFERTRELIEGLIASVE
jgi:DNA-binding NarL/FixJ family response regulator